ncbi:MAG TPA: hypothetical protein VIG25_00395 [Pyrinomonadaceae bacterium]|jgi:hypothetical protein
MIAMLVAKQEQGQQARARTALSGTCLLLLLLCFGTPASAQSSETPLTNASVIRLVKAGFKEKTVVAIIHSRPNQFKLDTDHLVQLKYNGVSENIILAMLAQDQSFDGPDDWEHDSFFRMPGGGSSAGNNQGADIFGSSSGSRSESRSRGTRGGNDNEGNITGSATVRILRPPAEAGTSAPKLERTPTLNNEEIIRLVDAGFSEGTIIKRIENSPAEFDLSPAKLDELRKHRVTDSIIAAMNAAMGDKE